MVEHTDNYAIKVTLLNRKVNSYLQNHIDFVNVYLHLFMLLMFLNELQELECSVMELIKFLIKFDEAGVDRCILFIEQFIRSFAI